MSVVTTTIVTTAIGVSAAIQKSIVFRQVDQAGSKATVIVIEVAV
jgi:hypothetical protein